MEQKKSCSKPPGIFPIVFCMENHHSNGKSPFLMGKSTINGHFQWLFLCLPGRETGKAQARTSFRVLCDLPTGPRNGWESETDMGILCGFYGDLMGFNGIHGDFMVILW